MATRIRQFAHGDHSVRARIRHIKHIEGIALGVAIAFIAAGCYSGGSQANSSTGQPSAAVTPAAAQVDRVIDNILAGVKSISRGETAETLSSTLALFDNAGESFKRADAAAKAIPGTDGTATADALSRVGTAIQTTTTCGRDELRDPTATDLETICAEPAKEVTDALEVTERSFPALLKYSSYSKADLETEVQ